VYDVEVTLNIALDPTIPTSPIMNIGLELGKVEVIDAEAGCHSIPHVATPVLVADTGEPLLDRINLLPLPDTVGS
jgi:hypothetical protein